MDQTATSTFDKLFDLNELQKLQDQFASAFGVASIITTPEGRYLTKPSNFSNLCQNIIRCTEKGLENCMKSDSLIGRYNPQGPIVQPCLSGGLWDAGASISVNGEHIANWLIGQIRINDHDDEKMRKYAAQIGADESEFMKAFYELPSMSQKQFQKIAELLFTTASQLSGKAYKNDQQAELIKEIIRVNEALLESEAKFRNFFENSRAGMLITGFDGSMQVNDAFSKMLGYSAEELSEVNFLSLSHPDDVQILANTLKMMAEGLISQTRFEKRYIHKNGGIVWAEISISIQRDIKGKPRHFIAVVNDITQRKLIETALIESESRYHAFVNANTDMIFVKDRNMKYLMANEAMGSFFGKAKEELIAKTDIELANHSLIYPCASSDNNVLENSTTVTLEEKLGERIFEVTKFPLNLVGNQKGIGGIMRDVTEQKLVEESLKAERALLRTLIDNLPVSIYVKDNNCRKVVSNIADYEKLGFSSESEVLGKTDLELFENKDGLESYNDDLIVIKYGKTILNKEEKFQNKDGSWRWTLTSKIPLIDAKGKTTGLVGIGRDITEQKAAGETIQKLSKGIEQNPATIVITDVSGTIEYVNPTFFEKTGYTYEEALGQNPRILKSGEMNPALYENLWQTISSGGVWRGELHNRKKNGELYWESATITSIKNEKGEITNYIAIKEDISSRKKMEAELIVAKEKAEESDRLKSAFLANMSHEIRTPLNSIIGFSELLASGDFDETQKQEFVDQIVGSGNALLHIISDIVDISKIEAGEISIRPSKIPVLKLIHDIELMFRHRIESKGLQLKISLPELDRDSIIYADYERVKQVFANLLGNALKFTFEGTIEITCRKLIENLEFSISDTGIGIEAQNHTKIFDRFRQVETSYNRKFGGNGLGLSITKNLVELMGGRIWLESDVDKGSTFYFTVPRKK